MNIPYSREYRLHRAMLRAVPALPVRLFNIYTEQKICNDTLPVNQIYVLFFTNFYVAWKFKYIRSEYLQIITFCSRRGIS